MSAGESAQPCIAINCNIASKCYIANMCNIDGCDNKPFAHGLCVKHYNRQRRHGDAKKVMTRGRKPKPSASLLKEAFKEWSPRTIASYTKAFEQLAAVQEITGSDSLLVDCIKRCTRPNGSVNVSKFARLAETIAAMTAAKLFASENDDGPGRKAMDHGGREN